MMHGQKNIKLRSSCTRGRGGVFGEGEGAAVAIAGAVRSGSQRMTDLQVLIKYYKLHIIKFVF
jgi:hypothetical protein